MPWCAKQLRWSLSEMLFKVPGVSGVYAIWRQDVALYVGETNDLQRRLLEHFKGSNPEVSAEQPTTFGFEVVSAAERERRRSTLLHELRPICGTASD